MPRGRRARPAACCRSSSGAATKAAPDAAELPAGSGSENIAPSSPAAPRQQGPLWTPTRSLSPGGCRPMGARQASPRETEATTDAPVPGCSREAAVTEPPLARARLRLLGPCASMFDYLLDLLLITRGQHRGLRSSHGLMGDRIRNLYPAHMEPSNDVVRKPPMSPPPADALLPGRSDTRPPCDHNPPAHCLQAPIQKGIRQGSCDLRPEP